MSPRDLQLKPIWVKGKRKWKVLNDLRYKTRWGYVTVPKGFVSDLGSIPLLFDRFIDPIGVGIEGFLLHDFLYQQGHINGHDITRRQADKILNTQLKKDGMGWLKRGVISTGLKLGGWTAWNKHRKLSTR